MNVSILLDLADPLRSTAANNHWRIKMDNMLKTYCETVEKNRKEPKDLKVVFLCDANPCNDVDVLLAHGIVTANMWAVTMDDKTFVTAKQTLKDAGGAYSIVNLVHSKLEEFIKEAAKGKLKFDIVYYDACGPLPAGDQRTLYCLNVILASSCLESPCALITTFSGPPQNHTKRSNDERNKISGLVYDYCAFLDRREIPLSYYVEHFQTTPTGIAKWFSGSDRNDGLKENLTLCKKVEDAIERDVYGWYGTYITQQVIDSATLFAPWIQITFEQLGELVKISNSNEAEFVSVVNREELTKDIKRELELGTPLHPRDDVFW